MYSYQQIASRQIYANPKKINGSLILSILLSFILIIISCKSDQPVKEGIGGNSIKDTLIIENKISQEVEVRYVPAEWKEIRNDKNGIVLDIRYASIQNFTGKQIYPCAACYLRPEIADRLNEVNEKIFKDLRWRLKIYDCYRPLPAQQKLWDIVPNPNYVTPPEKGSMHNRGMAVDVTLINDAGIERNMGTDFDFFGVEAHTDYLLHSDQILGNRKVLQHYMKEAGFLPIRTEWWHFYYSGSLYPLSEWQWDCDES